MNQYPKWLLFLLAPSLFIPIFTFVFYTFGASYLLNIDFSLKVEVLTLLLLLQLFWILPLIGVFLSLFLWGWMRETASKIVAVLSLAVSLASVAFLIL